MATHIREEHCGLSIANAPKSLGHKSKPMPTEVKLCLLTCCLFPDVSRIPIDDLVMYLMGLKLFEDVDDMCAARCRVHDLISIINNLKYPYNVIGGKIRLTNHEKNEPHNHYVKMPVGAHDLAKLMHLSCPFVFHHQTIKRKWPESNCYKDCYGLSLLLKKINKYPLYLECPKLALLLLHYREDSQVIPVDFFEGMKELCILSLDVPSLPQSLNVPWNLRTLRINVIKLDMSWIGGLTNLEFLSISTSSLTNIPREMGHLEKLRLLDLKKVNLAYIPPGVLSRMLKLEELYLPSNFGRWGCKAKEFDDDEEWELGEEDDENTISNGIDDGEKINASLIEIVSPSLNALNIGIPSASFLPKKSPIFKNIRQFKVHVPNYIKYQPVGKDLSNELHLIGDACDIKESGICDLMSRTEELSLIRVKNLKNVIDFIENNDFLLLKKMIISECEELECVVDATEKQISSENNYSFWKLESLHLSMLYNLKEICNERWRTFQWFQNLSEISIRFCHKLKYVFPMSLFSKGILLKNIEIIDCNEMEGVFYEDEEANVPLMHGSIENLDLHSLPKLIGFSVPEVNIIDGVHEDANQSLTANEIISNCKEGSISTFDGNFKSLAPNGSTSTLKESCVYDEQLIGVTQQLLSSKQVALFKIKDDIIGPMEMYYAFSSKLAEKWLQNLKRLKLAFCDSITIIFLFDPNHATSEVFISLKELELYGLRNLVHIWFQVPQKTFAFMNLQLLVLSECNNMYLFTPQVAKRLVQLKKLYISRCEKMEEVIVKGDGQEAKNKILFRRLKLLEFQYMPNLKIFSSGIYEVLFPLLDSLKTIQCNKMKSFSSGISWTPSLERVEINGNLYSFMGDLNATMKCEGKPYGHIFTFAELKHATQNFKLDNVLGQGGFGKVYKGWLDEKTFSPSKIGSGMVVAIKKLHRGSLQGFKAWQSEVTFLEGESHPNLVKLLGYCSEDEELLLVYEFMQNGSLDNHLFKRNSAGATLSWDRRIKIAIGVARGLHFLHTSKHKVIHRHIKPSNILIDSDYNARISDFGFARFDGTYGYVAPENIMTGHLYDKSDVYSFGVVLLEMMTGLRVIDMGYPNEQKNLVDWLKPILLRERKLKSIMDVRIEGQYLSKAMLLVAQLAFKCVQSHPINRPSMKDVLDALEQIDAINDEPLYVPSPRLRS